METPQAGAEAPPKSNRTLWIIIGAVVALCCCGALVAAAGFYSFTAIRSVSTQVQPLEEFTPSVPEEFESPVPDENPGVAPTGGLGNDVLRNDTWQYVAGAAVGQGCDRPIGPNSTIEVLQEPDAGGVWVEKWTVICRSGDSYAYEVTYTLDSTGATFDIKSLP